MAQGGANVTAATGTVASQTTEAVLLTTPVLPATAEGGQGNYLSGAVYMPAAAAASVVRVRVRQGSLTGTVVFDSGASPANTVGTAAVGINIPISAVDSSAASAGVAQYVVTVAASAGATGAGTTGTLVVSYAGTDG